MLLRECKPSQCLRTQYLVFKKSDENIKLLGNKSQELEVKSYQKNKTKQRVEKPKIDNDCPPCKTCNRMEFDEAFDCNICEFIIVHQKHQIDKKVLGRDENFSTRLLHANIMIKEIFDSLVNIKFNTKKIGLLLFQNLKGETK